MWNDVGVVTITGDVEEGGVLSANIEDGDGAIFTGATYIWQRSGTVNGTYITAPGATNSANYTIPSDGSLNGEFLRVMVSYTDTLGTSEAITSLATSTIVNVNDPVIGTVAITGTAAEGSVLSVNTSSLMDQDVLGTLNYQWQRSDTVGGTYSSAPGATNSDDYTIPSDGSLNGEFLRVTVSYTDGEGTLETVSSAVTSAISNVNDAPVGLVTISGVAEEGQMLTASNDLTDGDGVGTITYVWQQYDINTSSYIQLATGSTYTIPDDGSLNGEIIRVVASYTDDEGTVESVVSLDTSPIANVNDPVAGSVTITGIVEEGSIVTADISALTDEDGLRCFCLCMATSWFCK